MAAFVLQWQSWGLVTETAWLINPKIFRPLLWVTESFFPSPWDRRGQWKQSKFYEAADSSSNVHGPCALGPPPLFFQLTIRERRSIFLVTRKFRKLITSLVSCYYTVGNGIIHWGWEAKLLLHQWPSFIWDDGHLTSSTLQAASGVHPCGITRVVDKSWDKNDSWHLLSQASF